MPNLSKMLSALRFSRNSRVSIKLSGKGRRDANPEPEVLRLSRNGWVPNNETLPVLLYRDAIEPGRDHRGSKFSDRFRANGWPAQWRHSVYDFHHYHSTAHEVMGFAIGHARLVLGGEGGHEVTVRAGDVLVLPAGTGHCRIDSSSDFLAVGAYPPSVDWDICRTAPTPEMMERIRRLPFPNTDPIAGAGGSLPRLWTVPAKTYAKAS